MRYLIFFLFLLTALLGDDPYKDILHYRLDNGLNVYLYPNDKSKNIAVNVNVKVGTKAENEENSGISHLVEHVVFRDMRIDERDYLDLFKKEGASYVNGFTSYYKTEYVATIKAEKAYWIVEQFAQMLLDKNLTKEDLESERGALQVEIGEFTWADNFAPKLQKGFDFIKDLFPPRPDFYRDEFGIDTEAERKKHYTDSLYRINNQKFTLNEVMKFYHDYYYPANMTLNVVGNFDLLKMKNVIKKSFGKFKNRGSKSVENRVYKIAKLNKKPYEQYVVGLQGNMAVIGTKFIADDPKKVIVLKSYVKDLAERLNRVFRNKNGESYGAFGEFNHYHNAAIATVSFNAEHNAFDKNIKYTEDQIKKEANGDISDKTILEALKSSEKEYNSYENDTDSLINTVLEYQDFQKLFETKKTPYKVMKSITPNEFRTILQKAFVPENSYRYIVRDYWFFPHEAIIFYIFLTLLMLYMIRRFFGTKINKRIILERRLTSRLVSFFVIISAILVSAVITEWLFYYIIRYLPVSRLWVNGYDAPLSYLLYFVDILVSMLILYFVARVLYKWFYIKLFVTDHKLILSGAKSKYINIADISGLDIISWTPSLMFKPHGLTLLFWKPLLRITSHYNDVIYLRAANAKKLKSDLEYAIFERDRRGKRW